MKSCLVKCQAKGKQRPALALLLCLAVGIAYAAVISPVAAAQATQFSRPSQGADATAWFAFGLSLYEQKDYRGAKEAFEQVLLRDPQHQKAFEWLSRTQSKLWSNPAVENPPTALNVVAQADTQEGPYAAPTAREEEKARQQRIEQLFKAATALFKDKKYLDAQIKLNQLLEIDSDNRDARELAGKVSEALARVPSGDAPTGAAREAEARAKAEREAAEKGAREEAARRKAAEEEARKLAEAKAKDEAAAAKAQAEAERRAAREAEARAKAEREAAEKAARQEAARRKAAEAEARKLAETKAKEEAAAARAQAEAERRTAREEEARRKAAEAEARKLAEAKAKEEAAAVRAQAEAEKQAARDVESRAKAEREAAEKAAREEEARRRAAEEEARKLAEAKAKEEEAAAKARAEEEERQARTAEARRVAEQKAAEEAARAAVKTEQTAPPAVLVQPPIPAPAEANVEDYLKRAEQFAEFGNWESAAMNYREALRLSPRNERARRGLAKAEAELARAAAATGEADVRARAAELVQRGETLLRARNYAEAEAAFQQAHTLDPSNKDAAAGLREVAKRLGQEEKSAAAVQAKAQADKVKAELALAEAHKKKGEFAQAEAAYQRVLALDPTNGDAKNGLSKLAEDRKKAQEKTAAEASKVAAEAQAQLARSAQSLVDEGRALKDAGDLVGAVKKWQEAARLDADNELAKLYLKEYGDAAARAEAIAAREALDASQQAAYERALDGPAPDITYSAPDGQEITRILSDLSQVVGLTFVAADGVEGRVVYSLSGLTVRQVLDAILVANGFKYERVGDVVYVRPDFKTRAFKLDPAQFDIIKRMLEDPSSVNEGQKTIQSLLYGEVGTAPRGKKLQLNHEYQTLVVTDTEDNLKKVEQFLADLKPSLGEMAIIDRTFMLDPMTSRQLYEIIKIQLYPVIAPESGVSLDNRRLLLLKDDVPQMHFLIVRDFLPNIQKVEEILQNQPLQEQLRKGLLKVRTFAVTTEVPEDDEGRERVRQLTEFAYRIVEYMLYGRDGKDAAEAEGRRMEYHLNDPTTGRITVVDSEENLKRVEEYLNTVNEVTGDADQIRKYTIRIGNLWDVTDTIYRILMADPQAQSRRIYIDTTQLGQINRFGSIGGGRAQGVRYQPLITQRGQQDRSVTTTLGVESDLDIYDALFFPDPRTHTLFVRSRDPILFDRVQTLVGLLDIPPKMLEVEARLVEVALTELRSIGIDWSLTGIGRSGLNLTDFENVDFTADAMNQSAEGLLLNFATLGETQLTTVLSLISTLNSAEVLSAPRMITRSAPSEVPQINVSTLTPYIDQVEIVSDGDDDPTNNRLNVTYQQVEVGVLMSFYPLVTADNHVYLDIYPRISVVTDRLPVTIQNLGAVGGSAAQAEQFTGLGIPVIDSRESFNEVFLNNGETLVLGGLIRDELQTVENRVPLLHRLPIFGPLFKEQGKTKTKRTLLIFVTVNVLPTR